MRQYDQQSGFVLPGVLAYIAAALLIVSIGALALETAQDNTGDIRAQLELDRALDDAEARITYLFLTSRSVPFGLSDDVDQLDATAIVLGDVQQPVDEEGVPQLSWRADGEALRLVRGGVEVIAVYRDVTGLISLNSSRAELVSGLLEAHGVPREEALTLAARLRDYVDEDNVRRPRGAERADYRLQQRTPPSNSPLRTISEVKHVLGWEGLPFLSAPSFTQSVTISLGAPDPRPVFASAQVETIMGQSERASFDQGDPLDEATRANLLPGARGRFILEARDFETGAGKTRIVELQRAVADINSPFLRSLVLEETNGPSSRETGSRSGVKPFPDVFPARADEE